MEILGLNRGKIKVIIGDKSLIITGELTTTPIFYADINSIKNWEYPHNKIIINDEERENIIKQITEKTKDAAVKIIFD
ncbi:Imm74 family immunity protein [Tenacibaculum sp. UWU-22]|uniref:Imm74 family immunity protein n=1 Tax=Tenacibaculum sp. UWU-22 TaxID=3234187 RepID=UPI0034DB42A1